MSSVVVVGRLRAQAGREAELERLMAELASTVRAKDPATASFGFYRDADADQYVAVEVYESSEAALAHLRNIEPLLGPLHELADPDGGAPLQVYGDPSPELRARYEAFNAQYREAVATA